jgi:hypothetical protein
MKMRLVFILFVVAIAVADAFEGLGRLGMVGRSRRQHLCRPPLSVLRLLRLRIPALPLLRLLRLSPVWILRLPPLWLEWPPIPLLGTPRIPQVALS